MNWQMEVPKPGDMVRVRAGSIWHYGIYVSDEELIQFGYNPMRGPIEDISTVEVVASDMTAFLQGGFLETAQLSMLERHRRIAPEKTVEKARSRLGERGYSILYNNCEHFANECVFGTKNSSQTEGIRSFIHSLPMVEVYIAALPDREPEGILYPPQRQQQIEACTHPEVIRQRYYVWKLLEYALYRSLGLKMEQLHFKLDRGRWSCKECCFSLSHSHNALAVAVSKKPVGVDIERYPVSSKAAKLFLTEQEQAYYRQLAPEQQPLYLTEQWTKKESVFKRDELPAFLPKEITSDGKIHTELLQLGEERYCLSVANEDIKALRIREQCERYILS